VSQLVGRLARDAPPAGVVGFVFLFISVWWAWVGTTVYFDRFDRGRRWLRFAAGAAAGFGAAAAIWLVSAFVPTPGRFAVWVVAMVVDYATPLTARHLQQRVQLDPSHLPERFGLSP
jgi:low temperature requirement protein LtrA